MSRTIKKVFKVFCEGDTEYNYFVLFKHYNKLSLALHPINMSGGGYANFLKELKKDGNNNCLAKFIVIDGDRAITVQGENKKLEEIIDYCVIQNKSRRIPHIFIINYPDFEYVACLHSPKYKGCYLQTFLTREFGYKSVGDFKADKKVYEKLNSKGNSYSVMLNNINKKNAVVENIISIKKQLYEIDVKTIVNLDKFGINGTNIKELFEVLKAFEENI